MGPWHGGGEGPGGGGGVAISPCEERYHWEPTHEIRYNEKNMGWIKERAFMQRRHVYITLCFLLILGRMMKWRSLLGEEGERRGE